MSELLDIENLSLSFGGLAALQDFSMSIREKTIHALIGPNGAGKSTLFNCISCLVCPDRGKIHFKGMDLLRVPPYDIIKHGISRTYQNIVMFPGLTVEQNLMIGLHHSMKSGSLRGGLRTKFARREEKMVKEKAGAIAKDLGIAEYRYRPAVELPIGIQRLVELGRSLLASPRLLLLDEPASGLNTKEKIALAECLIKYKQKYELTLLLIEHDIDFVMGLAQEITVLNFGMKIAEGTPDQIQNNKKVVEAYLGDDDV
ncbi:MAG: ABC transporter ATP-binding protein [Deltaproteobacteria bacterium]|jgi:branched-chain amino acid transport system ATP-binding protein|nr:ABC transporter ATP-binding protein [Deltaproteobacteria bacterium]MBT4644494.1 ABC transporter ATP-binding protein [Deltaproteobacteria bacterium]MBT6615664.1 ABC transporter ATP-binding protein [Deltaproteobacteria bacterium]MBT7711723.1 ABC transporter ATP-binding protein [Deltaproteobacteria bacterium]